jgi:hypothetical protein
VTTKSGKSGTTPPDADAKGDLPFSTTDTREMTSGRVAFDARGNAVWEWRTGDGEFQRDASTTILRKLEPTGLAIEATGIRRKLTPGSQPSSALAPTKGALAESAPPPVVPKEVSGGDPYNSSRNAGHVRQAARRASPKPAAKIVPPEPPKGIIGRLLGRR